ncbi:ferredoxin [Rhodococcus rhodochrous KG-21]|uniref:Ferredoxin n=1 Tax=Rhodococcus rhodochrous KG-21 TaxID=1441923 RepID=A0A0M8PJ53_RHORH|nr:ferredoxin [Rhodococcus rhodochrous KG-21]
MAPATPQSAEVDTIVESIEPVAEGVVAVSLIAPSGDELPVWLPGAHLDLLLAPDLERQYSLCGDPADRARWRVAVLHEPTSRGGSEWVHTRLAVGDRLRVRGPRSNFPLVYDVDSYIMIAGGIGITPLLPMVRELNEIGADWQLIYGGRRRASMAFLDELDAYSDRVTVWPEDENGLLPLDNLLSRPRSDTAIYACGPEPLLAAIEERCVTWPAGTLHLERFSPRPGALSGKTNAFEVVLANSGETVDVAPDESIVEALEVAGFDVPTSCREGTCGTCETVVLEGTPDHRDSFLSPEEREAGEVMMICCSRSLTSRLVLDL